MSVPHGVALVRKPASDTPGRGKAMRPRASSALPVAGQGMVCGRAIEKGPYFSQGTAQRMMSVKQSVPRSITYTQSQPMCSMKLAPTDSSKATACRRTRG